MAASLGWQVASLPLLSDPVDPFLDFATQFADGERWRLLRAQGWEDFQERLAEAIGDLPVRRRQALMMLLFSLVEGFVDPADVADWLSSHDVTSDDQVEATIVWLRQRRRDVTG